MYYRDKSAVLAQLFGADEIVEAGDHITVDGRRYPVVDDVIVALHPAQWPPSLRERLAARGDNPPSGPFAPDVQYSFGEEWKAHPDVLPEHRAEFAQYFDLIEVDSLQGDWVCDLGCGSGRWATFVAPRCELLCVVDYSDAIFVARRNLADCPNVVFVMADVMALPFADDAFDLAYCLGVLHHLPVDARDALRSLSNLAPRLLVYLYYALDNRPWYFSPLLQVVTIVRQRFARITSPTTRNLLAWLLTLAIYLPASITGRVLAPLGSARWLPLAEAYMGKSVKRLRQDAYDRFFTGIEQRFRREDIEALSSELGTIIVSENQPYWHFLARRRNT